MHLRILAAALLTANLVRGAFGQDSMTGSFAVAGGMGVTVINAMDVIDYINATTLPPDRLDDFSSAAEFFGSAQFRLTDIWWGKLEYAYLINSYSVRNGIGMIYEYSYVLHMPTLMVQYVDRHEGYAFKVGGGAGYHVALLSERAPGASAREYRAGGLGVKIEAEGNTALGEDLFASIGGDVRINVMTTLKDSRGNAMQLPGSSSRGVKMSFFALGLKFGMIYYF